MSDWHAQTIVMRPLALVHADPARQLVHTPMVVIGSHHAAVCKKVGTDAPDRGEVSGEDQALVAHGRAGLQAGRVPVCSRASEERKRSCCPASARSHEIHPVKDRMRRPLDARARRARIAGSRDEGTGKGRVWTIRSL